MSGMPFPSSVGFLPSPLAGEGLGERGTGAEVSLDMPPSPQPLSHKGRGAHARAAAQRVREAEGRAFTAEDWG